MSNSHGFCCCCCCNRPNLKLSAKISFDLTARSTETMLRNALLFPTFIYHNAAGSVFFACTEHLFKCHLRNMSAFQFENCSIIKQKCLAACMSFPEWKPERWLTMTPKKKPNERDVLINSNQMIGNPFLKMYARHTKITYNCELAKECPPHTQSGNVLYNTHLNGLFLCGSNETLNSRVSLNVCLIGWKCTRFVWF